MDAPPFFPLLHTLVLDRRLGRSDLVTYSAILWFSRMHKKKCIASNEVIAETVGIATSNVRRSLRKLEQCGHIKCIYKDEKKRRRLEIVPLTVLPDSHSRPSADTHRVSAALAEMVSGDAPDSQGRAQSNIHNHIKNKTGIDLERANLLLTSFGLVNEVYLTGSPNTTQRNAMGRLLQRHTAEEIEAMVAYVAAHQGEQYFPSITTPVQLEQNWSRLDAKRRGTGHVSSKVGNLLTPPHNKYKDVVITR